MPFKSDFYEEDHRKHWYSLSLQALKYFKKQSKSIFCQIKIDLSSLFYNPCLIKILINSMKWSNIYPGIKYYRSIYHMLINNKLNKPEDNLV